MSLAEKLNPKDGMKLRVVEKPASLDLGDVAARIAELTRAEPHLLTRTRREVARAIAEGRAVVRTEGDEVRACLLAFRYGAWAEIGAAWVHPDARGRGVFADMHRELLPRVQARGLTPFEFPGSPLVERALLRMGATRAPLSALPAGVLLRFAGERAAPSKLASYFGALRAGTHRTSTRLYLFPRVMGPRPTAEASASEER